MIDINDTVLLQAGETLSISEKWIGVHKVGITARRHKDWFSTTFDATVEFSAEDKSFDSIRYLAAHKYHFFQNLQNRLAIENVPSSYHEDGYLDLRNGRWINAGCSIAMYQTNEYDFLKAYMGNRNEAMACELIHREVEICSLFTKNAIQAYDGIGFGGGVSHHPDIDISADPLIEGFLSVKATEKANRHLFEAHKKLQMGDALLLRNDGVLH